MTERHLTTRRGFITAIGFGAVGLYGAWAGYGAAPLPFSSPFTPQGSPEPAEAANGYGGHAAAGGMSSEQFIERHEAFLQSSSQEDGSVAPRNSSAPQATGDQDLHGAQADAHNMPADLHGGLAAAADASRPTPADAGLAEPVDVYLLAYRFGFDPGDLRLEMDRPYRFRMMASDLAHGASLQLGSASHIIRLRPKVVNEQWITFKRPGTVLVYCTLYCGPGHDVMQGRITVV